MWESLKSKKFKAFLGGMLIILGGMITGKMEIAQGIIAMIPLILGYIGVQGAIDYGATMRGTKE